VFSDIIMATAKPLLCSLNPKPITFVVFPWLMFLNDVYLVPLKPTAVHLIFSCPTSCWQQENECWETA